MRSVPRRFARGASRRIRQLAAGGLFVATVLLAPLAPPTQAESSDAAQTEIREALEKWRSAFNERDRQRVCDLFALNVTANYEGQPERDYGGLCELLQAALEDRERTYRYSLEINDILVYGDSAVVRLVWTLQIAEPGVPEHTMEEPAVDIFRHQEDGKWKISRYLAYSSSP